MGTTKWPEVSCDDSETDGLVGTATDEWTLEMFSRDRRHGEAKVREEREGPRTAELWKHKSQEVWTRGEVETAAEPKQDTYGWREETKLCDRGLPDWVLEAMIPADTRKTGVPLKVAGNPRGRQQILLNPMIRRGRRTP
ncbi:hypothetical protein NDU88_005212 [Pleurodeles waltl]|uniref:Uncharacterized protein n=1 Tax=Pleurodeles waltl TaxID=8319 RepID=A0AAV7UIJ1_PLEWA|nr:hypothetical protein NDU88_005212 [Pleurodeles waltl]